MTRRDLDNEKAFLLLFPSVANILVLLDIFINFLAICSMHLIIRLERSCSMDGVMRLMASSTVGS